MSDTRPLTVADRIRLKYALGCLKNIDRTMTGRRRVLAGDDPLIRVRNAISEIEWALRQDDRRRADLRAGIAPEEATA
jgi:hypothetical protein